MDNHCLTAVILTKKQATLRRDLCGASVSISKEYTMPSTASTLSQDFHLAYAIAVWFCHN